MSLLDNQVRIAPNEYFPALGGGGGGGGPAPSFSTVVIQDSLTVSTILGSGSPSGLNLGATSVNVYAGTGMNILNAGGGAGQLTVSSITVSSINGAAPGGGGAGAILSIPLSTTTTLASGNTTANIGEYPCIQNGLYSVMIPIDSITFNTPPANTDELQVVAGRNKYAWTGDLSSYLVGNWTFNTVAQNVSSQAIAINWLSGTASATVNGSGSFRAQIAYLGQATP